MQIAELTDSLAERSIEGPAEISVSLKRKNDKGGDGFSQPCRRRSRKQASRENLLSN